MIPIPPPINDPITLADWLEIRSLLAADLNASEGDLRRALSTMGEPNGEELTADAFSELDNRQRSCGGAYPFTVTRNVLQAPAATGAHWCYLFCLLLSYKGAGRQKIDLKTSNMFEEVAELAAKRYVKGRSMKFGFPRRVVPGNFLAAITHMCASIREGDGPRTSPSSRNAKDAALDVVAWQPFPDGRAGQLILFGQCAAGANWDEKKNELQPDNFIKLYWRAHPCVNPIKGFFLPFCVHPDRWQEVSIHAGAIFDRCRIAHLATQEAAPPGIAAWTAGALDAIRNLTKKTSTARRPLRRGKPSEMKAPRLPKRASTRRGSAARKRKR